jgi:hypothetical protein
VHRLFFVTHGTYSVCPPPQVIINANWQPLLWLAFQKQALVDEFMSRFRDMEQELEEVAECEALHQPPSVDNQVEEEEDEMQLEDYLFSICFDD